MGGFPWRYHISLKEKGSCGLACKRAQERIYVLAWHCYCKTSEYQCVMGDILDEDIKENASVVGSSFTEFKHEKKKYDRTASSSDEGNEKLNASSGEEQVHASTGVDILRPMKNARRHTTRYFVIKSLSHDNIRLSIQKGIWATQVMNEPILGEAFHISDRVILIFSVNMSGFFQGYAQMMSSVGWRRDNVWSKSSGGSNPWGRSFKVNWLCLQDLPFQKTLHLKNPLNDYKPVKISRDCQELSEDVGEALCCLFDEEVDKGNLKGNSPVHFPDQDSLLSVSSSHLRWAGPAMLHPSVLYQHAAKHDENSSQERSFRTSFLHSPSYMAPQKALPTKESNVHGSASNGQEDTAAVFQPNKRETPHDGNLAVSLSEEDFLNMTYEEYLLAVGRNFVSSLNPAAIGQSWTVQGLQHSREQDNDPYSRYLAEWHHSKKVKGHVWSSQ